LRTDLKSSNLRATLIFAVKDSDEKKPIRSRLGQVGQVALRVDAPIVSI
jgi:hypothetical protein